MPELMKLPYFECSDDSVTYLGSPYAKTHGLDLGSAAGVQWQLDQGILVSPPDFVEKEGSKTIVVIEPHPDDFALSASGYVLHQLSEGATCEVINIFSYNSTDSFPWQTTVNLQPEELEKLRHTESRLAVEDYLGQKFTSFGLPLARARGNPEVFATAHNETELAKKVGQLLLTHIAVVEPDVVLFPMAIQGHLDHLIAFNAALSVRDQIPASTAFVLYEDYPYARNKTAYWSRVATIQASLNARPIYVDIQPHLGNMADLAIMYRSQFNDVNRNQMLGLMQHDGRAVASEARSVGQPYDQEYLQRYWEVL